MSAGALPPRRILVLSLGGAGDTQNRELVVVENFLPELTAKQAR